MDRLGSVALSGADQVVSSGPALYRGITLRETTGMMGASVRVYDNPSAASGTLLEVVGLNGGGSVSLLHPVALAAQTGIYVDVVSGAVEGSIRVG